MKNTVKAFYPREIREREVAIRLATALLDEPNVDPDDELRVLSRQFLRECERSMAFLGSSNPKTVSIEFTVYDEEERVEAIRRIVSFEEIRQSSGKVLRLETEETLAKIATQGILKKLIETP